MASMGPAHYKDLREAYTKRMEVHGLGIALFHPIAAQDMRPPCCGYFDRNGDWNLICNLLPETKPPYTPSCEQLGYTPLDYVPLRSYNINIEWQPKTATGTQEHVIAGSAETPDNQPAGADVNIKYTSNSKFGAVLMTKKPITLTAFNDERLFRTWLETNRAALYDLHGSELKKYGMWLVTRTYTARGASINAWSDANKESVITTKAKAAMLGELGEQLNWNDRLSSRDWSHYNEATPEGLVVFMDGIAMTPFDWRMEALRQKVPGSRERDRSESRLRQDKLARRRSVTGAVPSMAVVADGLQDGNGVSKAHMRRGSPPSAAMAAIKAGHAAQSPESHTLPAGTPSSQLQPAETPLRRSSSQRRRSRHDNLDVKRATWYSDGIDEQALQNLALRHPPSRSVSPVSQTLGSPTPAGRSPSLGRSPSVSPNVGARSPSLRRETRSIRSISQEKEMS